MTGCSICFCDEPEKPYALPCGHSFCVDCIMIWFRSGHSECPMCRDQSTVRNTWIDASKRAQAIVQRARCKAASARLKKRVVAVQTKRKTHRERRKAVAQFKRQHKQVINTYNKLQRQAHAAHRLWMRSKNSLGFELFPDDEPLIHPFTTLHPALLQ